MQSEVGDVRKPKLAEVEGNLIDASSGSDHRSLLKRIIIYVPSSIVPAMLTLVTSVRSTRIFNPVAYGKYSLFLGLCCSD